MENTNKNINTLKLCYYCKENQKHKHKCPYKIIQIPKDQINNYKEELKKKDDRILELTIELNKYMQENKVFRENARKCFEHLKPIIEEQIPPSFNDIIINSYWDENVKKNRIKLFKEYEEYCSKENKPIYEIDNAFLFLKSKNYKSSTFKNRFRLFLRIFKKALKNPFIETSFFVGKEEKTKLKHLITTNEMKKLINYLKDNKLKKVLIIIELLFKFGVRIGAIARLKKENYDNKNKILTFIEKGEKIIRRKLLSNLSNKIELLIKKQNLKNNNFLFYHKFSQRDRSKFFSNLMIRTIKNSKAFNVTSEECFSAHMFRASHATKIAYLYGMEEARISCNHANSKTTRDNYCRYEDRGLLENMEEDLEIKSPKLLRKKRVLELEGEGNINHLNLFGSLNKNNHDKLPDSGSISIDSNYCDEDDKQSIFEEGFNENSEFDEEIKDFSEKEILDYNFENEEIKIDMPNYSSSISNIQRNKVNNKLYKDSLLLIDKKKKKVAKNNFIKFKFNLQIDKESDNKSKEIITNILKETNRIFSDNIICYNKKMYNYLNESKAELNKISNHNLLIYKKYKLFTENCIYPNLIIERIVNKGYGVKALNKISAGTLLCEYGGVLDYFKNLNDTKDIFILFKTKNEKYDRCINPSKYANLGRFFNCSQNDKEENIATIRQIVDDETKILFYTVRAIKKGEELQYNYNGFGSDYYFNDEI